MEPQDALSEKSTEPRDPIPEDFYSYVSPEEGEWLRAEAIRDMEEEEERRAAEEAERAENPGTPTRYSLITTPPTGIRVRIPSSEEV